jgi:hypothetical protein
MSAHDIASLVLGSEQRVVSIHESTIRSRSTYLNQLFVAFAEDAQYDDQARRILTILDYSSSLLNTYIHYLQRHLVILLDIRTNQVCYNFYAELYGFDEETLDKAFQNATIDNMVYASRNSDRI